MERRDFLKTAVAATGLKVGGKPLAKRRYRDDVQLSIIGFGGIVVVGWVLTVRVAVLLVAVPEALVATTS